MASVAIDPARAAIEALNAAIMAEKALASTYDDAGVARARQAASNARSALCQAGVDADLAWKVLL